MRRSLEPVLLEARTLPPDALAEFLGDLEQVRVTALARIAAPPVEVKPDRLLTVAEVADRLHLSRDYVYRRAKHFPFTVKDKTGRALRFSSTGLDLYLRKSH
jgi:excisionase family DNA binding protein